MGLVMMLIGTAAGGPDNAAKENRHKAANNEKNHGRTPCRIGVGSVPASGYLKVAYHASGSERIFVRRRIDAIE
jgi:hypothetical protein